MRKYFLSIVALAGMLFATSCQESLVEPQVGGTTTFTVQVPDQMGTKADPTLGLAANVNQLFVAVYADASDANAAPIYRAVAPVSNGQASVSLNLIQGQYYDVIFWAQVGDNYVSSEKVNNEYNFDLVNIPMNKNYHNTDAGAAFFYYWDNFQPTGTSQPVTLRRPFAQLNLGTTAGSLTNNAGTFTLQSSVIKVKGIADNFNTVSGFGTVTEANKDIEYTFNAVALPSDEEINVAGVNYKYVSMDYLPIVGDDQALITVDATITLSNNQSINHKFTNVPVRENYRTNIVGNLISSTTDFNVVVDDRFVDENGDNVSDDNNSWVVENTAAAQAALDNAKSGDVIRLVAGVNYGKLELRPTQANVVKVTTDSHGEFSSVEEYLEHLEQNPNVWHPVPHYTAEFKDITIIGAEGATIEGFVASSSHNHTNPVDYVRGNNNQFYSILMISNLKFENVNFTGKIDINNSDAESVYEGVSFEGCTFTTGGTAEANGQAIRYYNENNNGQVKNITVKDCRFTNCYQGVYVQNVNGVTVVDNEFETTGHNAIGIQGSCDLKDVVINNNTFNDIRDRIIRFNNVGADSYIEIRDNVATNSGDENDEVIKANSIAAGVKTFVEGNNWNGGLVVNPELKDFEELTISTSDELKTALAKPYNGVIINLAAGTYSGLSFINPVSYQARNVNIIGQDGVYVEGLFFAGAAGGWQCNTYGLTFKNITFTGDINLGSVEHNNILIENCKFEGNARILHKAATGEKINNLTVVDCTFLGSGEGTITAIMMEDVTNLTVVGCSFTHIQFNVLQAGNLRGEVLFDNNIINGTGDRVFRFVNVDDDDLVTISNNTIISDGDDDGELAKSTNPIEITLNGNTWNDMTDAEAITAGKLVNITAK